MHKFIRIKNNQNYLAEETFYHDNSSKEQETTREKGNDSIKKPSAQWTSNNYISQ